MTQPETDAVKFLTAQHREMEGLLRQVADLMLAPDDPYQALSSGSAAPRQQLRLVR